MKLPKEGRTRGGQLCLIVRKIKQSKNQQLKWFGFIKQKHNRVWKENYWFHGGKDKSNGENSSDDFQFKCSCNKIKNRMECLKCGYPFSESNTEDDKTPCNCFYCNNNTVV